jgi:hypothetical protein
MLFLTKCGYISANLERPDLKERDFVIVVNIKDTFSNTELRRVYFKYKTLIIF